MSENTKIEWADHTLNPWIGCTAISPGCTNCYASDWAKRYGKDFASRTRTKTWGDPVRWNKQHEAFFAAHGRRQRVFCASLADVFDNEVPTEWRMDLFKLIADTPNLDWLILTKRIGNVMPMCSGDSLMFDLICERVWLGATIVNQAEADRDIPKLFAVPAHKRFLSMEPLLGPVDLEAIGRYTNPSVNINALRGIKTTGCLAMSPSQGSSMVSSTFDNPRIDWVIVGGESGPNARPMHPDWARSLRDQCEAAGVAYMFKQWGEFVDTHGGRGEWLGYVHKGEPDCYLLTDGRSVHGMHSGATALHRIGKKIAGRLLDGITHDGVPS